MGRRIRIRWEYIAGRIVPDWLCALVAAKRALIATKKECRRVTYASPETEHRAIRIDTKCPKCCCEKVSVGRHGSSGVVKDVETLYSVLIAPVDLENDQIALHVITHAERKGMSVLRQAATGDEFEKTIAARIGRNPLERRFHGVVPLACSDIRSLVADATANERSSRDRLYCVLDTDMEGLPNHADVFATSQKVRGAQRSRLMNLMLRNFLTPEEFREGAHVSHARLARDGTT